MIKRLVSLQTENFNVKQSSRIGTFIVQIGTQQLYLKEDFLDEMIDVLQTFRQEVDQRNENKA